MPIGLKKPSIVGGITYSNNDLTTLTTGATYSGTIATLGRNTGKWYWEVYIDGPSMDYGGIGITTSTKEMQSAYTFGYFNFEYAYLINGTKCNNYKTSAYGTKLKVGDMLGIALDLDNHTISFYLNGVNLGVAYSNLPSEIFYPGFNIYTSGKKITFNFGTSKFKYTVPLEYKAYDIDNTYQYLIRNSDNNIYTIQKNIDNGLDELILLNIDYNNLTSIDFETYGFMGLNTLTKIISNGSVEYNLLNKLGYDIKILKSI